MCVVLQSRVRRVCTNGAQTVIAHTPGGTPQEEPCPYFEPVEDQQQQRPGYGPPLPAGSTASAPPPLSDAGAASVLCHCNEPCVARTANTSANPGRQFYRCGRSQDAGQCKFFAWQDEVAAGTARALQGPPGASQGTQSRGVYGGGSAGAPGSFGSQPKSGACFPGAGACSGVHCVAVALRNRQVWLAATMPWPHVPPRSALPPPLHLPAGMYGASATAGGPVAGAEPAAGEVMCPCGLAAIMRTSNSERNPGRQFWKCSQPARVRAARIEGCVLGWASACHGARASSASFWEEDCWRLICKCMVARRWCG